MSRFIHLSSLLVPLVSPVLTLNLEPSATAPEDRHRTLNSLYRTLRPSSLLPPPHYLSPITSLLLPFPFHSFYLPLHFLFAVDTTTLRGCFQCLTFLLHEVKERIRSAQYEALKAVNKELISLYWDIGKMIVERQQGSTWGKAVVERLASDLQKEFPGMQGFSAQNLWPKLQPLVGEISWSKNIIVMARCKDDLEREFYIRMTRKFGWSKNVLIHQIENFLREMGGRFAFIGSQYRLEVSDKEYFIDLLLFHRQLQCLVAVELKISEFQPEYIGKMQFYLAVLDDLVRLPDENPSIGIILCKNKDRVIVEYALRYAGKPIGVSEYRIVKKLPKELKGQLPSPEQIEKLLEGVE